LFLAVFGIPGKSTPVIWGMLVSVLVMIGIQTLPQYSVQVLGTKIFWPWYTLIGTSVTLMVAVGVRKVG
jgi:hypothetical protein